MGIAFFSFLGNEKPRRSQPPEQLQPMKELSHELDTEFSDRQEAITNLIKPFDTTVEAINAYIQQKNIGNSQVWQQQIDKINVLKQELTTWLNANDEKTQHKEEKITAIQNKLTEIKDILTQEGNTTNDPITSITAAIGIMAIELKEIKKESEKHGYNIYDILSQKYKLSSHDRAILETIVMFFETEGGNDNATRWRIKRYKEKSGKGKEGTYDLSSPAISNTVIELLKPTGLLDEPTEPEPTPPPFKTRAQDTPPMHPVSPSQANIHAINAIFGTTITSENQTTTPSTSTPTTNEISLQPPIPPTSSTEAPLHTHPTPEPAATTKEEENEEDILELTDLVTKKPPSDDDTLWGKGAFPADNSWIPTPTEPTPPKNKTEQIRIPEAQEQKNVRELFAPTSNIALLSNENLTQGVYRESDPIQTRLLSSELVAMGDAHGSALHILEVALMGGFITMHETDATQFKHLYTELITLAQASYDKNIHNEYFPFTSQEEIDHFSTKQAELLTTMNSITWVGGDRTLVLLGDTTHDRGLSDTITIALLNKIRKTKPKNVKILISNHDANPIFRKTNHVLANHTTQGVFECGDKNQYISRLRADKTKLDKDTVFEYLLSQDLFYYNEKTNTFFMHALVQSEHIKKLQQTLNIPEITDKTGIASFVSAANIWYRETIKKIKAANNDTIIDHEIEKDIRLLNTLVWTRAQHAYENKESIPFSHIIANVVHGHADTTERTVLGGKQIPTHNMIKSGWDFTNNKHKHTYNVSNPVIGLNNHHHKAEDAPQEELDEARIYNLFAA